MPVSFYRVLPLEANLRASPRLLTTNILTQLRQGQVVQRLPAAVNQPSGWLHVRVELPGAPSLEGFVKAFLLQKAAGTTAAPAAPALALPEAHLAASGPVTRAQTGRRAYSLREAAQPARPGPTAQDKAQQLTRILEFLDVEHSARYKPGSGLTYCNIYAHDYCHLAGAYLPRVWWRPTALAQLLAGTCVEAQYGATVLELNANSLYNWLEEFGPAFGWRRTFSATELQQGANAGRVALVCGQRTELNQPGHICAVVPELPRYPAARHGTEVTIPLQSQAGARNFRYGGHAWWQSRQFARFGFWLHE
ncbi:hypothetical protein K3G63_22395 [Hymenobacter sp. HSC-4F20]|uniref:hypothetical protein n=1 Tax=Hymenobacter sp. HSC-4F20 TaxID=2864135 RepID=UPI001C73D82F|nr:hypothetical protein [Hymenobacter sp. HSC-4F20]MBX0293212.1 hypothetical protein [Hymenobacter sp. HSC-4F20]